MQLKSLGLRQFVWMVLSPVECAVRAFGGVSNLARATDRSTGRVCGWMRAKERRGSGGRIPSDAVKRRLLDLAKERGLDLTAEDLIYGRDS